MATHQEIVERWRRRGIMAGSGHTEDNGIFRRLESEHEEIADLMQRLALSDEIELRRDLYPRLRTELLAHARAEEFVFYRALEDHPECQAMIARFEKDHEEIERLLDHCDGLHLDDPTWLDAFRDVVRRFQDHVEDEEVQLFSKAKGRLDSDGADALEGDYIQEKARQLRVLGAGTKGG